MVYLIYVPDTTGFHLQPYPSGKGILAPGYDVL